MNNLLIIDTTYPINTRTERFKRTLEKEFYVYVCAWSRCRGAILNDSHLFNYYLFKANVGYANQLKKLIFLPFFAFFALRTAIKVKPKVIFASHWDSLLCSVLIKLCFVGRVKLIYDCLDMPTTNNSFLQKTLLVIERFCIKFVDLTIFASRYFKELYPSNIESLIYENYPSKSMLEGAYSVPVWLDGEKLDFYKYGKSISWIGVVRYFEILENILKAIENTDYRFYVFGDGPDLIKLKEKVKEMKMGDQVFFFGRYSPSELKFIYDISSLVWAAYPTKDFNAVYAVSNKYFECSFFSKVPIISEATKMAVGLKGSSSVILLNEYSVYDIKAKIHETDGLKTFVKYEPDVMWEEKESELISFLKERLWI